MATTRDTRKIIINTLLIAATNALRPVLRVSIVFSIMGSEGIDRVLSDLRIEPADRLKRDSGVTEGGLEGRREGTTLRQKKKSLLQIVPLFRAL